MWTSQLQFGGVTGGNIFYAGGGDPNSPQGVQYWEGSSYQPRFVNPIIIDGYLYYTQPVSFSGGANGPTVCVNLKNGQILWSSTNVPPLSFGYVYNLWDPDQHGVFPPIVFTANFAQAFDGFTGDALFNVTGVPTGNAVMGPSGEQLRYVITNDGTTSSPAWYLSEWNSSKLWQYDINPYTGGGSLSPALVNASNGILIGGGVVLGAGVGGGPPIPLIGTTGTLPNGTTGIIPAGSSILVNASIPINSSNWAPGTNIPIKNINFDSLTTYDWNISITWHNTMALTPSVIAVNPGDIMLLRNGSLPTGFAATGTGTSQGPYTFFAVDLNTTHSTFGQVLWSQTYNPPAGNLTVVQGPVDFQTRVFVVSTQENMQWFGYSLTTGSLLWGPTASQAPFDYYGNPGTTTLAGSIAYGTLYCSSFSGILYAYNDLTGNIIFTYGNGGEGNSTKAGLNVFYGDYPTMIQSIANGVVYLATNEHTVPNPIYKGATTEAVNATTGEQIWQLSDYPSEWGTPGSAYVVADGYATFMNGYDNQIYSVGQGPSSTTVQATQTAIAAGTNVVIQGTVMDVSAGTTQSQQKADFPNGVPVASDASMTTWMGYVYQQQPLPTNFTGVDVSLDAKDPNGNIIHIGDANTTETGLYTYTWTAPNIPGDYLVTATFCGSNSYWGSSAQTGMNVQAAHPVESTPTATTSNLATTTDLMTYIVASAIAIIIVILIVGLLILRKHP
jgi:hypothetical protein